jgi:hypothetical protein
MAFFPIMGLNCPINSHPIVNFVDRIVKPAKKKTPRIARIFKIFYFYAIQEIRGVLLFLSTVIF